MNLELHRFVASLNRDAPAAIAEHQATVATRWNHRIRLRRPVWNTGLVLLGLAMGLFAYSVTKLSPPSLTEKLAAGFGYFLVVGSVMWGWAFDNMTIMRPRVDETFSFTPAMYTLSTKLEGYGKGALEIATLRTLLLTGGFLGGFLNPPDYANFWPDFWMLCGLWAIFGGLAWLYQPKNNLLLLTALWAAPIEQTEYAEDYDRYLAQNRLAKPEGRPAYVADFLTLVEMELSESFYREEAPYASIHQMFAKQLPIAMDQ